MGIPAAIRQRYEQEKHLYEALQRYVGATLSGFCDREHYQLMSPRVKELSSLADKLETGKYAAWSDINDLVAAAIIVPTGSHEDRVLGFLASQFDQTDLLSRRSRPLAPDHFRFDLTRWYGRVRADEGSPPDVAALTHLTFEVQVRTYFEHAWSVVTHDLTYKSDRLDWRRLRLAAQLKAMVEQIELTISNFEAVAAASLEAAWPDLEVQRQVEGRLQALLVETGTEEMAPSSWTRASESVVRLVSVSADVTESEEWDDPVAFIDSFCEAVRTEAFQLALSGSLLQAVYAFAERQGRNLAGFPVAASEELTMLYRSRPVTALDLS